MKKESKQSLILAIVIIALVVVGLIVGNNMSDSEETTTTTAAQTTTTAAAEEVTIPVKDIRHVDGQDENVWAVYNGDQIDTSFSGVAKNDYGTWYVKDGYVDFTFTGTEAGVSFIVGVAQE